MEIIAILIWGITSLIITEILFFKFLRDKNDEAFQFVGKKLMSIYFGGCATGIIWIMFDALVNYTSTVIKVVGIIIGLIIFIGINWKIHKKID